MLDRPPTVRPITTADYPLPAARPRNSALDMQTTRNLLGLEPRPWQEGLAEVLNHWAAN